MKNKKSTMKKREKKSIEIFSVAMYTTTALLVIIVFALAGMLYYMTKTADNLSAALGYKLAYEYQYEYGGQQRSIELDSGTFETQYEYGGQQREVQIDTGTQDVQIDSQYEYGGQQRTIELDSGVDGTRFETEYEWGGQQRSVQIYTDTGVPLQMRGDSGSLSIEAGSLTTQARSAVVELEGNSVLLINNNNDVQVYSDLVVEEEPGIRDVRITSSGVNIVYSQPAKFIGIVPVKLRATVEVTNQNRVQIRLPWYHFLFSKDVEAVESAIQFRITQGAADRGAQVMITSGGADRTTVQARESARRIDIVSDVVGGRTIDVRGNGGSVEFETQYEWGGEQREVEIKATPGGRDIDIKRY
jgi:hypothetical protein